MSGEIEIHGEILSEGQKRLLPVMGKAMAKTEYYLAGGTALALQIGHRSSYDFDWFTPKLGDPESLLQRLKSSNIDFKVQSIAYETVYIMSGDVQMSFIGYSYPMLQPKVLWPENGIYLAGLNDIASMKLSAIASRGSRKDFVDLYYLIKHSLSLQKYLELFMKKYDNRDIGHVVRSLVYFEDAESEPEIRAIGSTNWEQLKSDFEEWVKKLDL